jgi:hypothetical protein
LTLEYQQALRVSVYEKRGHTKGQKYKYSLDIRSKWIEHGYLGYKKL